jgi:hypothetical protein
MVGNLHAGFNAIYDALAAVSAITAVIGGAVNPRIYQELAVQGDSFPLILIQTLPSADDSKNASSERIFANGNFRVVGVVKARRFDDASETLKTEIDTAIDLRSFVLGSNRIMSITRTKEYRRLMVDVGIYYAWAGGDYKVTIK